MEDRVVIVFYDGDCGLCQRSIRFLLAADKKKALKFAPLNGETYRHYYQTPSTLTTVLLYKDGITFQKSSAVFELGSLLGGIYKFSYLLKSVPEKFRDWVYDRIAARRKAFVCILMTPDPRFLP